MQNFSTCLWNGVDRIVDRSVSNFACASTTFEDLDKLIDGFRPGELSVVSGVPGIGKTTIVLSMLYRMASRNKCPVGYITTETQLSNVSDRLVQIAFDVNKYELQGLKRDDFKKLCKYRNVLDEIPFYLDSLIQTFDYEGTYEDLKNRIRQLAQNTDCICIDCLQYLSLIDKSKLRYRESDLHYIVFDLKRLADELKISIILVSQMEELSLDEIEDNLYHLLWMRQYGDDGACSEVADVFIQIERPEYYSNFQTNKDVILKGAINLNVHKNRHGNLGQVKLYINGCRISEVESAQFYAKSNLSGILNIMDDELPF